MENVNDNEPLIALPGDEVEDEEKRREFFDATGGPLDAGRQVQAISAEVLIGQAIQKNVPVETMERLLAMRRELKAEWAKEQYDRAMAQFQADCPTIVKTKSERSVRKDTRRRYCRLPSFPSSQRTTRK